MIKKWTSKEIRKLFPIKIIITDKHRELANNMGGLHYLGDVLLKEKIPNELHEDLFWGLSIGSIQGVKIKTEFMNDDNLLLPLYIDKNFQDTEIEFKLR